MRSTVIALTLTALSVLWGPATTALAQESQVARGTIAAITGQSVTLKVGDRDMKFTVDNRTTVQARGASTKSARAAMAGRPGPHLDEVLERGQAVAVTYNDLAGMLHATAINAIPKSSVRPAGVETPMKATGVVKAVGADWITINGRSGGGATFEQTFKIEPGTSVFAKGATHASEKKGGRLPIADLIAAGDRISVSYHRKGGALTASDIHVTMKATP